MHSQLACLAHLEKEYESMAKVPALSIDTVGRWTKNPVTYMLTNDTGDIPGNHMEAVALNQAFLDWGIRIPLRFKRVYGSVTADISAHFAGLGTDNYFTSESILAYAWYPNLNSLLAGDIVINDMPKINWSLDGLPGSAWKYDPVHYTKDDPTMFKTINLRQIFKHELGHALGLTHEINNPAAMMYPYYHNDVMLGPSDISRIQNIYGKRLIQSTYINSILKLIGKPIVG